MFCLISALIILAIYQHRPIHSPSTSFSDSQNALLLQSGLTSVQEAQVRVVLWFDSRVPKDLILPTSGWTWETKVLKTGEGGSLITSIVGERTLNVSEEEKLWSWFLGLAEEVKRYGGRVYLDERINEAIDIARFLSEHNVRPLEWALAGNVNSIAGLTLNGSLRVSTGLETINIQLALRSSSSHEETVLAVPALLEEF